MNAKAKVLAEKYMNDAIAEGTSDKLHHGMSTQLSMDGSYKAQVINQIYGKTQLF